MTRTPPSTTPGNAARRVFAKRLREARVAGGFKTARSFAQALGIDENRYTRYERAEVEPDLELLMMICERLSVAPNALLTERKGSANNVISLVPTGMAEDSTQGYALSSPATTRAAADGANLRRRAMGWQLARAIAQAQTAGRLRVDTLVSGGAGPAMQQASRIFAEIERDPFWPVTVFAARCDLSALEPAELRRIEQLIDDLVTAQDTPADPA